MHGQAIITIPPGRVDVTVVVLDPVLLLPFRKSVSIDRNLL